MSDDDYEPPPGILKKTRSLPRLQVEDEEEIQYDHPGHRHLTPQPTKRKPFIPAKPSINNRRSFSPYSNGVPEDIAEHPEEHNGPHYLEPIGQGMRTHRSHSNTRLEEAKRDLIASSGPLTPRRKAPTLPTNVANRKVRRRQSETNASDLIKLQREKSSLSPDSSSPDTPGRPRKFLTPQPKRKQFNTDKNKSFDTSDILHGTTRSPVERLAKLKMSQQRSWGSSDSSDSSPSPTPQSVSPLSSSQSPRSPSSLSSSPPTPSSTSPKHLPISPLASPLKVTNTQNSPLKRITWTSTVNTTEIDSRPQRKLTRSRPQSFPERPVRNTKTLRKTTSGSSIRSTSGSSGIRKPRKHRSVSTVSTILRSPDRNMDPVQPFGAAYQAEQSHSPSTRQSRKSQALRDELFNSIILTKTEQATLPLKVNTTVPLRSAPSAPPVNRTSKSSVGDQENTQLIAKIARQKSGIDTPDGYFENDPTTPGSPSSPTSQSSGYNSTPSPTSSPHRPKFLRHMSSVSSMKSSIFGSREVLNDLFLSDRGTHKGLKAFAGFITGLILGIVLFLGLYYGLKYGLIASICITAVSTLFMALCLAFTVRGRCVALLMVPTLCTQRGRAAFLAIVVALLLNGPINNIFHNANEVSTSMSCSAELAYNQSQQIKQVAAEVFDQYVRNLEQSVQNLQNLADGVQGVFQPIEDGLDVVQSGLNEIVDSFTETFSTCYPPNKNQAQSQCNSEITDGIRGVDKDCRQTLGSTAPQLCNIFTEVSAITSSVCGGVGKVEEAVCLAPVYVTDAVTDFTNSIEEIKKQFQADFEFNAKYNSESNQSSTFEHIQQSIEDDIDYAIDIVEYVFRIIDKLIALSVVYLLFKSYVYHTEYRTKDKFDNFYVTHQFKILDGNRKKRGKKTLLPLKKSEKVRLIDVTSFRLSKPEKGLFKIGMVTLLTHICIAIILILVDNGLYWLMQIITEHGSIQADLSGEIGADPVITGESFMANMMRQLLGQSLSINITYDVAYDNTKCLPIGTEPNHALAAGIMICYVIAIFTVLFQAYALRLRRHIASYFYPERELERLYFLYNDTLKKRQTLFKFLKDIIKQKQKENDATEKVSLRVYLADRHPTLKKIFKLLHIMKEPKLCYGCDSDDDGTFKRCEGIKCTGRYCEECLKVTNNACSICGERLEDVYEEIPEDHTTASDVLSQAGRRCRQVIQGAYLDCTNSLSQAYRDCKRDLTASKAMRASKIETICEVVNIGGACKLLRVDGLCEAPTMMDQWVDDAAQRTMKALQDMRQQFNVDVDFSLYWQERWNTSRSFASIQQAVKQELDEKIDWADFALSIANKLIALSILWLCFMSYQYHMKYRTKDRFDNFYITKEFKKLDAKRKEQGKPSLLPLKKSEKYKLVDLTQFSLSKPEKGLFKLGLLTVIMHSLIAGILVLVDYGLFALLELIRRHGQVKSEVSGEHSTSIDIKGQNAIATFIRETFINSFEAASVFNSTIDSDLCLPKAAPPDEYLSITIGSLYLLAILTVLFQAYALRLRRRIASFYYPERELERLYYLYNHTIHKRQSLANFLQQRVKENQHELESQQRVSFRSFMALRYPRSQKFFRLFGMEKHICLGCANEDEIDTYKTCATPKCPGRYCFECFQEIAGICSLCEGIIEEACEEAHLLEEVKKPKEETEICDWHYKYIDKSADMADEKMIKQ